MENINNFLEKRCENEFPIIMSVDDNYAPYMGVAIASLIQHSNTDNNYTVYILDDGISSLYKQRLLTLQTNSVKIKYIDIKPYFKNIDEKIFYLCDHFTLSVYYRIFIPQIFKNFDKVLYCDCDAIFLDDDAKIYNTDLSNKMFAVVHDTEAIREFYYEKDEYFDSVLHLKNPINYFQSGFLLMNIKEMIKNNFTKNCIDTLQKIKTPRFPDQDILNVVCENKVEFLDGSWNVENHLKVLCENLINELPHETYIQYEADLKNVKYLHFTGYLKPWQDPASYNADLWWKYAQMTPFYEEIIYRGIMERQLRESKLKEMQEEFEKSAHHRTFVENIFSVKNEYSDEIKHKVLTILGIKIKFNRK